MAVSVNKQNTLKSVLSNVSDGTDVAKVINLASNDALSVAVVDSSGNQVSVFSGTQYTEGDTDSTITGSAILVEGAANTLVPVQGTVADGLLVNLGSNNDVTVTGTVTANLASGTNNIGDVDVLTVPAPLSLTGGGVEASALRVTIASDSTGVVSVDDNGSSITVDGTVTVTDVATATKQDAHATLFGAVAETAPGTDTASSGLNGRLQRIAQRLSSLIALFPTALGSSASSASLPVVIASDQAAVKVKGNLETYEVTPTLDTSAYTTGDVLFATTAVTSVFDSNGGKGVLTNIVVNDKDDQGIAFDLFFLRANTSVGTINNAPSITDAGADDIIGRVSIAASDYTDLGGTRVAVISNIGQVLEAGGATTSLWIAGVTKGTPTHTAAGLVIKFGFVDKT